MSPRTSSRARIVHLSVLLLILCSSLVSLAACTQQDTPWQLTTLNLGIPDAALQSSVKGTLPDSTVLHIRITFKIDPHLLQGLAQPRPQPGQEANAQHLAKQLGIDDATYQKLKAFFSGQGFILKLSKLRTYLSVDAPAGTLAKLLHTTFVIRSYKGRTFYAPDPSPEIPTSLANSINAISGLDNYSTRPKHAFQMSYPHTTSTSRVGTGARDCNADSQTLIPSDIAGVYGYDALHRRGLQGQNMTVNLVEIDGSSQDDIQNYLNCISFKGHLSFINIDGKPSDVQGESTLDVDMIAGLAPAATIKVYQTDGSADGDTWSQVNDELQQILNDNASNGNVGSVVSVSLGIDEADITSDDVKAIDSSLQQLTRVEHMTVFVASGDCAAFADETFGDLSVSFPASDPWSVAVGGTDLSVDDQHHRTDEVVWSGGLVNPFKCNNSWGSGGGNSQLFKLPHWQRANGANNRYSQNVRQMPDVSAAADNLAVYFQGQWGAVAGTSAAAPIWAAGQALINQDTLQRMGTFGYAPQFYYEVANAQGGAGAYFDVTSGNNLYYPATTGWDFASGLGTPKLANLDRVASNLLA